MKWARGALAYQSVHAFGNEWSLWKEDQFQACSEASWLSSLPFLTLNTGRVWAWSNKNALMYSRGSQTFQALEPLTLLQGVLWNPAGACAESRGVPESWHMRRVAQHWAQHWKARRGLRKETHKQGKQERGTSKWGSWWPLIVCSRSFYGEPKAPRSTDWETLF